jgi:hypothetical protein
MSDEQAKPSVADEQAKPGAAPVRLARPMSTTISRAPTYRVSKAQSLRMRAHDKKVEAAEAAKAKKLAAAQKGEG